MSHQRRRLRNLLLDRRYQLQFTAVVVFVAALLTAGLGAIWFGEVRQASKLLEVQGLETMNDSEVQQLESNLRQSDYRRLTVLILFAVVLSGLLTVYSIVLTHKVAGPIYKIGRHVEEIRDGKLPALDALRKGDQLHEFWVQFSEMHDALRQRAEQEARVYAQVIAAAEKVLGASSDPGGELSTAVKALRALREQKEKSLQG